jgi:DNA-binding NarL/FixJ family response regulator
MRRKTGGRTGAVSTARGEQDVAVLVRKLVAEVGIRHGLSPREAEVLEGAALGRAAKAVAADLSCSPKTVEEYWRRIYRKMNVDSRQRIIASLIGEAVASAVQDSPRGRVSSVRSFR